MHPKPSEVKVVSADQLKQGMLVYAPNGWLSGPVETNGCFRKIVSLKPAEKDPVAQRDLYVQLEIFVNEPGSMVMWLDNHTLVMVHKDTQI